jgi:hypothetical protein
MVQPTMLQKWQSGPYSVDWGSVPDWLVLVVAVVGTFLALQQLMVTAAAEQGTQLMAIDQQVEGDLVESRKALVRLRLECNALVNSDLHGAPDSLDAAVAAKLLALADRRKGIADPVDVVRKSAVEAFDEYFSIMRLPMFVETIGVLVDDGLVNEAAVLKLYDAMIVNTIGLVLPHIVQQRVARDNPELLLHAERLYERAAQRMADSRRSAEHRQRAARRL